MKPVASILFVIACALSGPAAANLFLQLPGIEGESTAQGHEQWIELTSYQFGASNPDPRAASAPSVSELVVTKSVDLSSPLLFQAVGAGTAFANALLDVTRTAAGQTQTYMKYELSDVFITSYSVSSSGERPTESLSLNFTKVEFSYFPQLPNGALGDPIVGSITAVPEPSTWALLAAGLLVAGLRHGRAVRRG